MSYICSIKAQNQSCHKKNKQKTSLLQMLFIANSVRKSFKKQ